MSPADQELLTVCYTIVEHLILTVLLIAVVVLAGASVLAVVGSYIVRLASKLRRKRETRETIDRTVRYGH